MTDLERLDALVTETEACVLALEGELEVAILRRRVARDDAYEERIRLAAEFGIDPSHAYAAVDRRQETA